MEIIKAEVIPMALGSKYSIITAGSQKKVKNGWLWNGRYTEYKDGTKSLDTVNASTLFDFAKHYWLDGYISIEPLTKDDLRAMERELSGYYKGDIKAPDGEFLSLRELPDCPVTGDKSLVGKEAVTRKASEDFIKKMKEQYPHKGE